MKTDMTVGSPLRHIITFMVPLLIGNTFQQLYNMVDSVVVGRYLGVDALAAVGSSGSIIFLINGFAIGLTSGFSIIIAQHYGAGAHDAVKKDFFAALMMSLIAVVVLTVVSISCSRSLLALLQTPENVIDDANRYVSFIYGGMFATILFNLFSNVLRAIGNSRMPLVFLMISCALNVVLDIFCITVIEMGVEGVAIATVLSQFLSVICCLVYIARKVPILHLNIQSTHLISKDVKAQVKMGASMGFQSSIISIGSIIVQTMLNRLGSLYVASYTAAGRIESIVHMPLISFGLTMATYVGQNYGAKNLERIRRGVRQCLCISVGFSLVTGVIIIFWGYELAGLFVPGETQMMANAQIYLRISGGLLFVLAILYVIRYSLQGLGQSVIPTFAGIMELFMRMLAAVVLSKLAGFSGICWANPLAWIGACIPLCLTYLFTMRRMSKIEP